ncbi:hypothetical protein KUTeg_004918 [Tegillarca granosa]|uniref:Uncharacterized protein n=1 Tax=Tegillarca granosa TaxID=220873 RepID=A0ABQ9FIA0_TEGGR|nr:hypothetical protein KUTeg_004918 [Tegillarca granosa]
MAAPMDLNVCLEEAGSLKIKVKLAFELGYDVIAVNYVIPVLQSQTQKKKRKSTDQQQLLSPSQVKLSDEIIADLNLKNLNFNIFLTFKSSEQVQSFELIAVQPTSEKTFHALERGIHFEIQYSPAIRDSSTRKNTISNALSLMSCCKGKNVILTSGCLKPIELRGPYDVANLYPFINK